MTLKNTNETSGCDNASGLTVFEGMTSTSAVINSVIDGTSDRRIVKVLYAKDRERAKVRELRYLRERGESMGFTVEAAEPYAIAHYATGASHGGIIALCSGRSYPQSDVMTPVENGFYVLLEGLEDPFNLGFALRSVYAAGADGVILPSHNCMVSAGIVCRSSAGTSELSKIYVADDLSVTAKRLHGFRYRIACAGIRDSVSAFDADLKKPLLLVIGGEKRGISRSLLEIADLTVRLDYGRPFKGSLSASSAASVLAYEVLRQNR